MKRTLFFLATGLFMTALAAGSALAADTPPGQPSPKASQAQGQHDSSGSRERSQSTPTGLPLEAPWISLALANGQSIGLSAEQQRALEALRSDYQQRAAHQQESIEKAEIDLERILSASLIDLDQVRTQLNTIGTLAASARLSRDSDGGFLHHMHFADRLGSGLCAAGDGGFCFIYAPTSPYGS